MAETKFLDSIGLTHLLEKINAKFSKIGHKHTKADITDFAHDHDGRYYTETEIDTKVSALNSAISGKANSSHTHAAADITSVNASAITGTIAAANLPKWNAKADITIGTAEPTSSTSGIFYIQTN